MILKKQTLIIACALFCSIVVEAQESNCTYAQVENNTVEPSTLTIGETVHVATTGEFLDAIEKANRSGGNLTILIADGTYNVTSGAAYPYITASDVVIRSASGNRDAVILTGDGMHRDDSRDEIVLSAQGNNITIADLTIREAGNHGVMVDGDYVQVHNVRLQDIYEQQLKATDNRGGSSFATVQCSLFEYTAGVGPQWYIGGIDVHQGNDWLVRDNVFKNIASPDTRIAEHAIHFWSKSKNISIDRNKIINSDRGIGFGTEEVRNVEGGLIKNNMIYNDGQGLFSDTGIVLEASPNVEIYNNNIYLEDYPNAIEYRFASTENTIIKFNRTNKAIKSRDGASALVEDNEIYETLPNRDIENPWDGFWTSALESSYEPSRTATINTGTDSDVPDTNRIFESECLRRSGPRIDISRLQTNQYRRSSTDNDTVFDATNAKWTGTNDGGSPIPWTITLRDSNSGNNACWFGADIRGAWDDTDPGISWENPYHHSGGITIDLANFLLEGIRIDNQGDGIRAYGPNVRIRAAYLSDIHDDCIENDDVHSLTTEDSLLDGCYVAFSARPFKNSKPEDGSDNLWIVRDTLVRLEPQPTVYRGPSPGHGGFFKWDSEGRSPQMSIHNTVFRVDQEPNHGTIGIPDSLVMESCSNNTIVWLGSGEFPETLPSCFTVTTDESVWDDAVAEWRARHPNIQK